MANMTVKHLLDGIAEILQDTAAAEADKEWTESYLIDCYNIEARAIAAEFPNACTITEAVKLSAGVKHSIPAAGIALITILMNMGTTGLVHGEAVRKCDLAVIPLYNPNWAVATADDIILHFMPDPADPKAFYSYPPADGTSYVLEEYSVVPKQIVYDVDGDWELELVSIAEDYLLQLEKRIIARCYKKDSDIPGNMTRENDTDTEVAQEKQK
jgi:hypothetical protein